MTTEKEKIYLKDIAEIHMGQSPPIESCNNDQEGVPLLNGPTEFGSYYPSAVQFTTDVKRYSEVGDLLFCVRGSVGKMNWSDQRYAIGRGLAAIRLKEGKKFSSFLKGCITQSLNRLLQAATASTFLNLTKEQIEKVAIKNFLPDEVKSIESILGNIDSKIKLNNILIKKLDALAKLIFEYWFLQLDFPNDINQPYKISGGKTIFNAKLNREIPEKWRVLRLSEISKCIMGQSPKGFTYNNLANGPPLINGPADYKYGSIFCKTYTTQPTRMCCKDDLVLCIRATIGNLVYSEGDFCLGRGVAAIRPNQKSYSELIYFHLLNQIKIYQKLATGSIIKGISKDDLENFYCLIPDKIILDKFHQTIKPIFDLQRILKKENIFLSESNSWLLPLLINKQAFFKI